MATTPKAKLRQTIQQLEPNGNGLQMPGWDELIVLRAQHALDVSRAGFHQYI